MILSPDIPQEVFPILMVAQLMKLRIILDQVCLSNEESHHARTDVNKMNGDLNGTHSTVLPLIFTADGAKATGKALRLRLATLTRQISTQLKAISDDGGTTLNISF